MKNSFKEIVNDKITVFGFSLSLLVWGITTTLLIFFYSGLPPFIPLYNKRPWGYARLGTRVEIVIPALLMVILFVINIIVSSKFYTKNPLVSRLIAIVTVFLTLFFCILIGKIIGLVS